MFDTNELASLDLNYFTVIYKDIYDVTIKSNNTGHYKPLINIEDNDRPDDNYIVVGALASGEPVLFKKNEEKFYVYDHDSKELDDDLT